MAEYCRLSWPHVLQAAENLGVVARGILLEGLRIHGLSTAEFSRSDNLLTQHFKDSNPAPNETVEASRLLQLAEVARSLHPSDMRRPPIDDRVLKGTFPSAGPCDVHDHGYLPPIVDGTRKDSTGAATRPHVWRGNSQHMAVTDQRVECGQISQNEWLPHAIPGWQPETINPGISYDNHMPNGSPRQPMLQVEAALAPAADDTMACTQDGVDGSVNGIWDDFIVNDFAGSLHYP